MSRYKGTFRIKSLNGQLILRVFAVLFLMLLVMEVTQYFVIKRYLYMSKEELLLSRLHNVEIGFFKHTETPEILKEKAPEFISKMLDLNVAVSILDDSGALIAMADEGQLESYQDHLLASDKELLIQNDRVPYLSKEEYQKLLIKNGIFEIQTTTNDFDEPFLILTSKVGEPDHPAGLIQLSTSIASIDVALKKQLQESILVSVVILSVGLWILSRVIRWTLVPLNKMKKAIDSISILELNQRLSVDQGQEEIDQLSMAYNQMLNRIEESFNHEMEIKDKMKRFISDASHELRTPLTSIHGFAEILLMGAAKDEDQVHLGLNTIMMESDRLTLLVKDLLTLSKLDQNNPVEMKSENLADILLEIKPQLEVMSPKMDIKMDSIDQSLWINCNRNQIKQVIFNLVQNAIQFTDPLTGVIRIEAYQEKNTKSILVKVSDNGIGISHEDQSKLFDRFYRAQEHRSRETGGYGLGLSIVKTIMTNHEGEILIESELGKGTIVVLKFKSV